MTGRQPWATALAVAAFSATTALAARVPHDDELFARKAAEAGMDEIAAARVALQRSHDEPVRQFAQRMIDDHGKAGAEQLITKALKDETLLQALASKANDAPAEDKPE